MRVSPPVRLPPPFCVLPVAKSGTIEAFRYTGNATLEWHGPEARGKPGDISQLQIIYAGPSRSFQIRDSGFLFGTLSFTHSFDRTLSLTGKINGIGTHGRHSLLAPLVQEQFDARQMVPELSFKLVRTFGVAK